ncbi:MAG: hypothetical protein IH621_07280 [Krumholzibacteria bacterium]|nr:hypothetical protein [Candidatus Krumholzibacteria bacterium]
MDIPCPKCGHGFNRWQVLWLTRLFSFGCAGCGAQIAITIRGRAIMWGAIVLGIAVGAVFYDAYGVEAAWLPGVLGGYVLGALLAPRYGTIGVVVGDGRDGGR